MFEQVIVGVDGGATGRDAVALARQLISSGIDLALAHVHELTPVRGASGAYGVIENDESRKLLEREREASGVEAELLTVTASSVGRGLHYLAHEHSADLLVVGSNPRSLVGRVLLGDVTRAALVGASCAVAVAPLGYAQSTSSIAHVGVAYDGSSDSEAALKCARELAGAHAATLKALAVVEPSSYGAIVRAVAGGESEDERVARATRELAALDGVDGHVTVGDAGEELAKFGDDLDLLVIGSRGYGPLRTLMLGSTATYLAGNAACPLLVLPREDE
jgi:nucleotide-binding universal stress UspA family protein